MLTDYSFCCRGCCYFCCCCCCCCCCIQIQSPLIVFAMLTEYVQVHCPITYCWFMWTEYSVVVVYKYIVPSWCLSCIQNACHCCLPMQCPLTMVFMSAEPWEEDLLELDLHPISAWDSHAHPPPITSCYFRQSGQWRGLCCDFFVVLKPPVFLLLC